MGPTRGPDTTTCTHAVTTLAPDPTPSETPASGPGRLRRFATEQVPTLIFGPDDEEIQPQAPPPLPDPHTSAGWLPRHYVLALSTMSGLVGSLVISASAPVWRLAAPGWRLTLPGIDHPGDSTFSIWTFLIGVVLLALGWIGLIGRSERQRWTERRRLVMVAAVLVIWAVPLALAPPLLSNDAYSYAAQGELASRGIDPTAHGPVYLGRGDFLSPADPVWRNSPAPYGPVWIQLSEWAVDLTGHDPSNAIWVFRGLAVLGVAMTAVGVAVIARSYRLSMATAVAIGVANPLVLLHLVGGSHNDALMLGFLAVGLAAVRRGWRWLGVVLLAMAMAIKLPAGAGLLFVGWVWSGTSGVSLWRRMRDTAMVCLAGGVIVVVLCRVVGVGVGWITALSGTGKILSTFSLTTKLGFVSADVLRSAGIPVDESFVVSLTRLSGVLLSGLLSLFILLRSPRIGLVRSVGLVMFIVILLGPVLWPWYMPAGFALLAASGLGRYRPSYLVVTFALCLLVWPTSVAPVIDLYRYQHLLGLGVVFLIGSSAYGAQRLAAWRHDRRLSRHATVLASLPPLPSASASPAP